MNEKYNQWRRDIKLLRIESCVSLEYAFKKDYQIREYLLKITINSITIADKYKKENMTLTELENGADLEFRF